MKNWLVFCHRKTAIENDPTFPELVPHRCRRASVLNPGIEVLNSVVDSGPAATSTLNQTNQSEYQNMTQINTMKEDIHLEDSEVLAPEAYIIKVFLEVS